MTFPTAEDIEIIDSTHGIFYLYIKTLNSKGDFTKESCESLKQQILSEHEIVERLKVKLKEREEERQKYLEKRDMITSGELFYQIQLLKSILENKPQ